MNAKLRGTPAAWTDPDDAPELTTAFFDTATPSASGQVVSRRAFDQAAQQVLRRGRPVGSLKTDPKISTTIRLSPEVVQAFREAGDGWQTRIDAALKDWLRTHSPN
jgi:uncharacterized protein (DUF4415 family)